MKSLLKVKTYKSGCKSKLCRVYFHKLPVTYNFVISYDYVINYNSVIIYNSVISYNSVIGYNSVISSVGVHNLHLVRSGQQLMMEGRHLHQTHDYNLDQGKIHMRQKDQREVDSRSIFT